MTSSQHTSRSGGFSLIELMVVIAIIAIGVTLAVPYFGGATTTARQRSVVDKMVQDFTWARTAAGVADASTLGYAVGTPTITIKLWDKAGGGCSWTTQVAVNGSPPVTDTTHSMTATDMAKLAPGITCGVATDTLTLPVTFTFDPQGFIGQTGTISYSSTQAGSTGIAFWPLMFLTSGSVLNTNAAS